MAEDEQVTPDVKPSDVPVHVEGARRAEDMVEHDGHAADDLDLGESGAGRPAGGHTAHDPMRTGQDKQGMKDRGTVDPDGTDPSGGAP